VIDDVDRIMAIMDAAFEPAYGEAWNRRQVEDALILGRCQYLLIGPGGEESPQGPAIGFSLSRPGFGEEELLLFAIDPAYRQKGLGRQLLEYFASAARARGAERLLLEMRRGNSAERLYRAFGFIPIGERPKYYRTPDGNWIDAITFSYEFD
jgi:ribosomal-protein-alanine N-acetyltransferase